MIFKTHGHHLKVSLTTMETTRIILFQMLDQDIVRAINTGNKLAYFNYIFFVAISNLRQ